MGLFLTSMVLCSSLNSSHVRERDKALLRAIIGRWRMEWFSSWSCS